MIIILIILHITAGHGGTGEMTSSPYDTRRIISPYYHLTGHGQKEWSVVIAKSQFDDQTDYLLSYQIMNTGGSIHFLFNQMEKRVQLLNDFTLQPDGKINRNPYVEKP
ncbi:MAG: hypothetical protein WDN26_04485 [Chitinophagaceae bacterium]